MSDYILYLRTDYNGSITNTTIRSYVRPVKAFLRFYYEEEVLHLESADIDAAHHLLHIRISKKCKSRITMIPDFLSARISEYIQQSGIPRLHAHLLRHTFATAYLCGSGNLEFLRVLMGHSDYGVTKIYSSLAAQYKMLGVPIYRLDPIFFRILG